MKPTAMQLQDYADFQSPDRSRSIDIASPETGAVISVDPVTLCVGTYDTTLARLNFWIAMRTHPEKKESQVAEAVHRQHLPPDAC